MGLGDLQQDFTRYVAALIGYAYTKGYTLSFGDAYRDARLHGGWGIKKGYASKHSLHKLRLAIDLNLFVDGRYITDGNHPAYQDLGTFWESSHELARWGGRFEDANHFSFEYKGYK